MSSVVAAYSPVVMTIQNPCNGQQTNLTYNSNWGQNIGLVSNTTATVWLLPASGSTPSTNGLINNGNSIVVITASGGAPAFLTVNAAGAASWQPVNVTGAQPGGDAVWVVSQATVAAGAPILFTSPVQLYHGSGQVLSIASIAGVPVLTTASPMPQLNCNAATVPANVLFNQPAPSLAVVSWNTSWGPCPPWLGPTCGRGPLPFPPPPIQPGGGTFMCNGRPQPTGTYCPPKPGGGTFMCNGKPQPNGTYCQQPGGGTFMCNGKPQPTGTYCPPLTKPGGGTFMCNGKPQPNGTFCPSSPRPNPGPNKPPHLLGTFAAPAAKPGFRKMY
jgi:hypothetical protein